MKSTLREGGGEGETTVHYRDQVYRQHICQLQYQQPKCKEQFRICGKGEFKIFPFFKVHLQNKYLREQYEKYFRDEFIPMLHW